MSDSTNSRFKAQNQTTNERLSSNTVGLVALSDFRKRRAEVLEQQEREAREAAFATPDRSMTTTPKNASDNSESERKSKKKKAARRGKALVSFGDDEEGEDSAGSVVVKKAKAKPTISTNDEDSETTEPDAAGREKKGKFSANTAVGAAPRAMTKAALRREAAEREALRKEFLVLQAAVKATDIAIPFVFYDGTNIPGGTVRVKKGDFVWFFLDKSRKVGAELGVGGDKNANVRREWARVGVDDLMLVRGTMIIPHHYEFYFFIMNKSRGPGNTLLFDYSAEAPPSADGGPDPVQEPAAVVPLSRPGADRAKPLPDINSLEGASEDPTFTKVVDRRWYERNKHIYPANVWQEFDPEKDYQSEIRRDPGGNAFFFSK
ncbi:XAP5-domain-containing protein [Thozetella sp. PMI_491]|nr:XAP5-domain-containing protein [Thozetella sp. PMI_491]